MLRCSHCRCLTCATCFSLTLLLCLLANCRSLLLTRRFLLLPLLIKLISTYSNFFLILLYLGDPDYKLKCIGFWKENLRSYLITYDELDAFSRYRCWVYQRADLTKIYMSQALGPYCPLNQDVTSWNYTEGAAVHLNMEEYERERKNLTKWIFFLN